MISNFFLGLDFFERSVKVWRILSVRTLKPQTKILPYYLPPKVCPVFSVYYTLPTQLLVGGLGAGAPSQQLPARHRSN